MMLLEVVQTTAQVLPHYVQLWHPEWHRCVQLPLLRSTWLLGPVLLLVHLRFHHHLRGWPQGWHWRLTLLVSRLPRRSPKTVAMCCCWVLLLVDCTIGYRQGRLLSRCA